MASSKTEICNSALTKVGAALIGDIDELSFNAEVCKEQYDKARRYVLRAHPWRFAIKRATLSAIVSDPEWGYGYQFQLPSDCLKVVETDLHDGIKWEIENGKLLTNASAVKIKYIYNAQDVTVFDANFEEALALRLAADICYKLTQNATLQHALYSTYKAELAEARSVSAQETSGDEVEASTWINVRY